MKILIYLFRMGTDIIRFWQTFFGEKGLSGYPKRLRDGFKSANNDPVQGPKLRAARYENIDGSSEISFGMMVLFCTLSSYFLVVFPGYSLWKTALSFLLLFCGCLAPYYCRRVIKKYITWPRTGYVALRRAQNEWVGVAFGIVLSVAMCYLLLRWMQPEINRLVQSELSRTQMATKPTTDLKGKDSQSQTSKISQGYLGINMKPLSTNMAKAFNLPETGGGIFVAAVNSQGAAEKAGLKSGDVILELNGQKMPEPDNLKLLISGMPARTFVSLRILHPEPGQTPVEKSLTVELGETAGMPRMPAVPSAPVFPPRVAWPPWMWIAGGLLVVFWVRKIVKSYVAGSRTGEVSILSDVPLGKIFLGSFLLLLALATFLLLVFAFIFGAVWLGGLIMPHGGSDFRTKLLMAVMVLSTTMMYLNIAAVAGGKHSWKWLVLMILLLGSLGICVAVQGTFFEMLRPLMLFEGLVLLFSGAASLYLYLRQTPPPAPAVE